jgi:predicted MFS family arabinose efflux permease
MNQTRSGGLGEAMPTVPNDVHLSHKSRQTLVVAGAGLGMGGGFAALYFSTMALFLKPIATEFGWGRAQTSAATMLAMVGMAVGAMVVGRLIDRFGAPRMIALSAIAMSLLTASLSLLPGSPAVMGTLCFLIGLVGVATTPLGYLSVLPRWFDVRLGFALGAAMVGLGLGTIVFPVMAQKWILALGWRDAYVALAATSLLISMVAWGMVFSMRAPAVEAAVSRSRGQDDGAEGVTLRQAVRSARYWLIAVVLFVASAAGLGVAVHGAALLTDRGLSPEGAAQVAALSGLGVMLGRLAAGALMDAMSAPPVGAASFLLGATGIAIYAYGPAGHLAILSLAGVLAGFAIGAEGDLIPFAVRRYFGTRAFSAIYGTLFGVYALGGVVGPVVFGIAFDRTGGYRGILTAAAIGCVLAAIGALGFGPDRYRHAKH